MMRLIILFMLSLVVVSCGKTKKSNTQYANALSAVNLTINVFYEEGAEPYVGSIMIPNSTMSVHYWDYLEKNLAALFLGRDRLPKITVPKELDQMKKLGKPEAGKRWSIQDAIDFAKGVPAPSDESFNIFFVTGRAKENDQIIGFNLTGQNIIFIFKEVITSSGTTGDLGNLLPKFVEQATLIHEMGHAIGLVNNGLNMQVPHEDDVHKKHCTDENCVMYYANEGVTSLIRFAQSRAEKLDLFIMFDNKCLNDARAYRP